ncbi:MAG TPA: transposase [Pirellulales bacterium]|nr:transposase [Pirellulales bacterium]
MTKRRIYDNEHHAHFLTFSCYKRRRLLDHDRVKRIVLGTLNGQLRRLAGSCVGFVIMPNHVHAIVWFEANGQLSEFLKQWKRTSSLRIKDLFSTSLAHYASCFSPSEPVWQPRSYGFNLYSRGKIEEKLDYIHLNPVRAGLVSKPCDWPWSSARHYLQARSVGVPIRWIDCD